MLPTPVKFTVVAASSEGGTELNAFDNAILKAGIGNLNLLRVSSILPPGAREVESLTIAPGSLVPTAFGTIASEKPGEVISAAIGVGLSADTFGAIMEFSGHCHKEAAEAAVKAMVEEAFQVRQMPLARVIIRAAEHKVERCGCAFAGVALWY
ncbi:MAG TPA: arginine decarboxylase, pyruvoyl-dependent [Bacillota bacterium]